MLFFVPLLHPPPFSRCGLYSARSINQRNLPNATLGDNLALCHDPRLYGLFNRHASNRPGADIAGKRAHLTTAASNGRSRVPRTRRCGIRIRAILVSSSRKRNLRVRWDVENVMRWAREPGGPSQDLWTVRSATFEGNSAKTSACIRKMAGRECNLIPFRKGTYEWRETVNI